MVALTLLTSVSMLLVRLKFGPLNAASESVVGGTCQMKATAPESRLSDSLNFQLAQPVVPSPESKGNDAYTLAPVLVVAPLKSLAMLVFCALLRQLPSRPAVQVEAWMALGVPAHVLVSP